MKNLNIYNVYVEMQDQEQCYRMEQLCIDYNLPYWGNEIGFQFEASEFNEFSFCNGTDDFFTGTNRDSIKHKTKVTEEQFINLLKQHKI